MIAQISVENDVQTDGFAIVEDILSREKVDALLHALERIGETGSQSIAASSIWTSPLSHSQQASSGSLRPPSPS